ncbi:subtilisin-like protein [Glonium stellatum]|uniref:Subtilisin-like protein n=1 Tax=Glonium stellatum TaxID=574774 RepID=A0A8E2JU13_9PEZI|nr:subtilisin-like protein [Glonium stellatum]
MEIREGRADEWFNRVIGWTHPFVKGKDESFQKAKIPGKKKRQVRVAILDTGFAYCTDSDKKKTSSFKDKVQKAESFLDDEDPGDGWKDDIGHGTAVAYQLAQVCPDAKLYICRIARKVNGKTDADRSAVVRALKRLTEDEKWKVDIINMSFGWEQQDDDVECALHEMQDKGVLLFASASNFGALGDNNILYPARSRHVISVDAADGLGEPATFNSSSVSGHTRERFSAPGWKVKGPANERVDGTSYASPIAVAIAALVLEFARQPPLGKDDEIESYLKKKDGIVRIFRLMSIQKGPEKLLFLCPWHLLRDKEGTYGGNGEPKSKRFYVAQQIIYQLRDEFLPRKGKIGQSLLMD